MNDQQLEARVMSLLRRRADEAVETFDPDLVAASAISRATQARRRRWRQLIAAAAVAATLVVIGLPMVARDTTGDTPTRMPAPSNSATATPSAAPQAVGKLFLRPFTYELPASPSMNIYALGPMRTFYTGEPGGVMSDGYGTHDMTGLTTGPFIPEARGVVVAALVAPKTHACPNPPPDSPGFNRVPVQVAPQAFLDDLQAIGGITISDITPVTVDDRPALSASVPGIRPDPECNVGDVHFGQRVMEPYIRLDVPSELFVFEVDDVTMVIQIWAATDEGLVAWRPTAMAFVDSIHFAAP